MLGTISDSRVRIIALVAAGFFVAYSLLIFANPEHRYTWPDEMANYRFITQFVQTGSFRVPEPLAVISKNLVHPRSTNVFEGAIVPGTFIGFVLIYGVLGFALRSAVAFVTPALAAGAGIALYYCLKKFFDEHVAFFSAMLYFFNPAVWYYASFALLPNIPFISLAIIGTALGIYALEADRRVGWWAGATACIALAIAIRPTEVVWLAPALGYLLYCARHRIHLIHVGISVCVIAVLAAPVMWFSRETFGSILGSGYVNLQSGTLPTEAAAATTVGAVLLPFGFHPLRALRSIWAHALLTQWWIFIPVLWKMLHLAFDWKSHAQSQRRYALWMIIIAAYLALYYGSWAFEDQVTLKLSSLGISYVRYWLPIFVAVLPFAAEGIMHLGLLAGRYAKHVVTLLMVILAGLSANAVWFSHGDSLYAITGTYREYTATNRAVIGATEPGSVIITERGDKIFWPERAVISKWSKDDVYKIQALAIAGIPLYFFGLERDTDIAYLNQRVLGSYDLRIDAAGELVKTPNGALYHIAYEPNR